MRADHPHPHPHGAAAGVPRSGRHQRTLGHLLTLVAALAAMIGIGAIMAGSASANGYNGLLSSSASVNVPALIGGIPAGSTYQQLVWSAPAGVQFHGFAYTSGAFWAQNFDLTGGLSAGFKGSGGSAPTDLNFPWTTDCSISEDDSPRTWINNGVSVSSSTKGPYGAANGDCGTTAGNTSGWNYTNAEVESSNPAVNPQTDYQSLTLSVWCARDAACNNDDSAAASVTNLSGNFDDSYDQPSGSAGWSGVGGSAWEQTNSGNVALSASANDPAGVCSMQANLTGPQSLSAAVGNQGPAVTNVGGAVGTEFQYGTNPCWTGQTDSGSWTLPAGLASGSYSASLQASNPGNYEAQGFSAAGSPIVATASAISIDDQAPTVQLLSPTGSGSWTSSSAATVDVSTGPSGLSSLTCTDNGAGDGATRQSSSGNAYVYTVPLSTGSNNISCSAANGDGNGALTGNSGTGLYQQDAVVPTIVYTDTGYTPGTWTSSSQTVNVRATGGPSGITGLSCTLNGHALPDGTGDTDSMGAAGATQTASVTLSANGARDLSCTAENAGTPSITGSGDYQVDVDSQVPVTTFLTGNGYAATSTQAADPQTAAGQNWLDGTSNTITIGVTGTEPIVYSGVQTIECTINGYTPQEETSTNAPSTGTIAQNTPFMASFAAGPKYGWIDGQNVVACQSDSLAGVVGADGRSSETSSIEYVDVNDPSFPTTPGGALLPPSPGQCGISSVINNGGCAYSNGPSQMAWYSSAQHVTITADDTGAAAPITSITCSGVPMSASSWTAAADPGDVDGRNGLTVVATINPDGGKLDCSASDSASPVDTYELGTYNVSIDPSTPKGFFEPQGYQGAAKNILQLKLDSNPSGIERVTVQATDENTGVVYTGDQLTANPADGHTAYATLDQNTGTWNLTINPAVFPSLTDRIKFVATATTNAGVTGTINTAENGSPEVVTPAGLGGTTIPIGAGYSETGDGTAITATAQTGHWTAAGTREQELPTALQGTSRNPLAPTPVATVASWKHSVCKAAAKRQGKNTAKKQKSQKRACTILTSRAPKSEALPANYNQETEITGTLTNTHNNTPMAGGSIGIYATNLVTDQVKLAHVETTGPRGRFSYRLAPGPARRVDLIYLGQWDTYHGADTAFDTTTAGRLRAQASRAVRVGQTMRLAGRILGGSIQTKGAIVQMLYTIAGVRPELEVDEVIVI